MLWTWMLVGLALADEPQAPRTAHLEASLHLQVHDREVASEALIERAEEAGGYFSELGGNRVILRVPSEQARDFTEEARDLGRLVDQTWRSTDLSGQLVDVRSRLASREQVLDRYFEVLEDASPEAVVSVERRISQSVEEIENLRGRLRVLEHQTSLAKINVGFRAVDRQAPTRDGTSSFDWLNRLNVGDVIDDLQGGNLPSRTCGVDMAPPSGFAAYPERRRLQAVSPDNVVLRVRTERHRPQADLAFWQEAVRGRMSAAGYTVVSDETIQAGGAEGGLLELAAPVGEEDWTYLIAFFVTPRRLIVAEAAGESERFQAHREAVLEAMRSLRF